MNLQENINRIQEVMGIISEDKHSNSIQKMIDDVGVVNTIKFFGGYDEFKKYEGDIDSIISRVGKIEIIQDILKNESMIYGNGNWAREPEGDILFEDDKIRKVIFGYYDYGVFIETYRKNKDGSIKKQIFNDNNPDDAYNYEYLPDDVFEQVFQNVIKFAPIRLTGGEN
jgi:hypothetical protein